MQTRLIKSVLIGDSGVGKTSIINAWRNEPFKETTKATIGADFEDLNHNRVTHQLWDTAGNAALMDLNPNEVFFQQTSAFIFVIDGTKPLNVALEAAHIRNEIERFKEIAPEAKFYVVVNKCDGELHADFKENAKAILKQIIAKQVTALENLEDDAIFFCSAKTSENISELLNKVERDFLSKATLIREKFITKSASFLPYASPSESLLEKQRILENHVKVWIEGNNLILFGSAACFVLAAFTAGSFLTLGILPSAFIGAAIIMGSALLVWNLGCAIYHSVVENAASATNTNFDVDESANVESSEDPEITSTLSNSYGNNVVSQPQQEDKPVDASADDSDEEKEDRFPFGRRGNQ